MSISVEKIIMNDGKKHLDKMHKKMKLKDVQEKWADLSLKVINLYGHDAYNSMAEKGYFVHDFYLFILQVSENQKGHIDNITVSRVMKMEENL